MDTLDFPCLHSTKSAKPDALGKPARTRFNNVTLTMGGQIDVQHSGMGANIGDKCFTKTV